MDQAEKVDGAKRNRGGLLRFLLFLALFAWALRSLIVAPFSIPSGSMLPTMYVGDYLFVQKWPYGYSRFSFPFHVPPFEGRVAAKLPKRGDIVILRPAGEPMDWVKRVIGLPGDRVAVRGGQVILNGRPVPRVPAGQFSIPISPNSPCRGAVDPSGTRCLYPAFRETLPGGVTHTTLDYGPFGQADNLPEAVVPSGHLFLMGDNRDDSKDSRFIPAVGGLGFVPVERLVGRAAVRFWSTDGSATLNPVTWFRALRSERILGSYYE